MQTKLDLINDWNDIEKTEWINNFIFSEINRSEKIDVLKFIAPKLKDMANLDLPLKYKTFFELVLDKSYNDALKLCDLLSLEFSEKRCELKEIIKNKDIYFLSPKLEIEMGGLGRTVLYRANFLADEGYNITLLNIGPVKNYEYIIEFYKNKDLFSENISFVNIFDYYSRKNQTGERKPALSDNLSENIFKKENSDKSITLKYLSADSELIKTETYIDECMVYQQCDEYNRYFTKDGFNYLTNDKLNKKFILKDKATGMSYEFNSKTQFLYHFLEEICLNREKPFIVCDSTSHWYDANVISLKDAYKIGSMHGSPFVGYNPKNKINKNIKHLKYFDNINRLVLLTNDLKNDLKDKYDSNKLVVIPNFVSEDNLDYEPVKKDLNKIAVFSRISHEKQISHAIKAFDIVTKQNDNAILEIYGGASNPDEEKEDKKIKNLVKELKLEDKVIFKGFTSDIAEPMRKSLATLLTSKYEGLPLSILESMTNSTAVISYDCYYGPSELISNDVDGILIEQDNIDQLAQSILRLLDNPDLAIEMGKKGKEKIINNYTLSHIAPKWENLFSEIYVESEINDFIEDVAVKNKYPKLISKNNKLKKENKKLKKENSKLNKFKKEVLSSTSWKITGPLRKLKQIFKRKS